MPSLFKYAVTSPRLETLIARAKELETQITTAGGIIGGGHGEKRVGKFVAIDRRDAAAIAAGLEKHITHLEQARGVLIGEIAAKIPIPERGNEAGPLRGMARAVATLNQKSAKQTPASPSPAANARALELLRQYQTLGTENERREFAMKHHEELRNGPLAETTVLLCIECGKGLHGHERRRHLTAAIAQIEGRSHPGGGVRSS